MVGRSPAADADVLAGAATGWIAIASSAFTASSRSSNNRAMIAESGQPERQLRHVVRTDRHAVKCSR